MEHPPVGSVELRLLQHAVGRMAGHDVMAPDPYPIADVSAVDGYAVTGTEGPWIVVGELAAGEVFGNALLRGQAVRIFTGAAVPEGTEAVLMQERCERNGESVRHPGGVLRPGANIRRKGESVKAGERILAKGSVLTPAAIGLLASCGVKELLAAAPPKVAIIRTGGEFITIGAPREGRIHSSNDPLLVAALRVHGELPCTTFLATDELEDLRGAILAGKEWGEVVITTGGASVGEHDRLVPVLSELGARIHFHGVSQKPGKPMFFATLDGVPFFGLPGNPRAVLVLFHLYVLPFLRALQGASDPYTPHEQLPIAAALEVSGERTEFRAARVLGGRVHLLADEGSHMLRGLVEANALAVLPAEQRAWAPGDPVEVYHLPHGA